MANPANARHDPLTRYRDYYNGDATKRNHSNTVYSALNEAGG